MVVAARVIVVAVGFALALAISAGMLRAGAVDFVAAERPGSAVHFDSLVLPLSRDQDVAPARDLIARGIVGPGSPIVFVEGSAGAAEPQTATPIPLPAPVATGIIGLLAVGFARWWPGAPWGNR